jgi:hypothetical protein
MKAAVSFTPKPVIYRGNGGGRDSYIIHDSGGFYQPRIDVGIPKLGYQISNELHNPSPMRGRNSVKVSGSHSSHK